MQQTRYFSLLLGVVYLLIGIIGFIPGLYTTPPVDAPHVDVTAGYGYLFGIFPVNVLLNIVHILIGLAGVAAGARFSWARTYCALSFLVFGLLSLMGFMPTVNTAGGYAPLFSGDTWLHAATAVAAALFAFVVPESTNVEPAPAHGSH